MDFSEQLQSLAKKIAQQSSMITTEEATKNAFVMPFLNRVLGYDVRARSRTFFKQGMRI